MQIEEVSEQEWNLLEHIGLDLTTREIATLFHCRVEKVWRMRTSLGNKLNLKGARLIVAAVKSVWIQEHSDPRIHIAQAFKQLTLNQNTKVERPQ